MKSRNRRNFKRTLIILIFLGFLSLHFYIPRFIVEIKNPIINLVRGKNKTTIKPSFKNNKLKGKSIVFKSFDKTELSSYLTFSSLDSVKGTVILLHGIRSRKETFVKLSKKLSELGYNSVALDSRAHAESKGAFCTFGVYEKKDISELIKVLNREENIGENIGVWGRSLGGAIGFKQWDLIKK